MTRTSRDSRLCRRTMFALAMVLVASVARAQSASQSGVAGGLDALAPGWNRVDGGPTTTCSLGSPYGFFVEPGDSRRLMVYFQGGGACWDAETCDVKRRTHYFKPAAPAKERPNSEGVFDSTRADNPVRGFTKVFIPYCTGDVHLGARTVTYTAPDTAGTPAHTFEIHHNGGANVDAALNWIYGHVAAPQTILVTGESAGSVPTPFYAAILADRYPTARIVQLGDASSAYDGVGRRTANWSIFSRLRVANAFRGIDTTTFNYLTLFQLAARSSSRITFAVVNSVEDSSQAFYLRALDPNSPTVRTMLARHDRELSDSIPRFHSYTYPGWMHTIIGRPEFYTMTVDGVRLRDWLAELIDGSDVPSVGRELLGR